MIKVDYDCDRWAIIVEFHDDVDAAQADKLVLDLEKVLPRGQKDFKLLADYSAVGAMEPEVENAIKRSMDLFNARGVTEVFRVLPDPDMDIGFRVMSLEHYSKRVRIHTVRSRAEADALLRRR